MFYIQQTVFMVPNTDYGIVSGMQHLYRCTVIEDWQHQHEYTQHSQMAAFTSRVYSVLHGVTVTIIS